MRRIISTSLIILGILLIFSPIINKQIIKKRVTTTQNIIEEVTFEKIEENTKKEAIYDFSAIKDVGIISTITGNINFDDENVIGQIVIDDLNMNLPIMKGITNSNLLAGAATMSPEIQMGKGNYSLAGHYMKDNLLFGSLLNIEIGTIVKITDKNKVYEYEIYDIEIVPDTAFYMLDQDRAKKRKTHYFSYDLLLYFKKWKKILCNGRTYRWVSLWHWFEGLENLILLDELGIIK